VDPSPSDAGANEYPPFSGTLIEVYFRFTVIQRTKTLIRNIKRSSANLLVANYISSDSFYRRVASQHEESLNFHSPRGVTVLLHELIVMGLHSHPLTNWVFEKSSDYGIFLLLHLLSSRLKSQKPPIFTLVSIVDRHSTQTKGQLSSFQLDVPCMS